MKAKKFFPALLMALLPMLWLASCSDDEEFVKQDPLLELSQESFEMPMEGGICVLSYRITNPIEGEKISVENTADWITDLNLETEGQISFKVGMNKVVETRSTQLSVNYPGIEAPKTITVTQAVGDPHEFVITISEVDQVSALCNIIPYDKEKEYVEFLVKKSYLDDHKLNTDEALWAYDLSYIKELAELYEVTEEAIVRERFINKGDIKDRRLTGLEALTDYVQYAYTVEFKEGKVMKTSVITREEFSTLEVEMIQASFAFENVIRGNYVDMKVTAQDGYEGYFFFDVFKDTENLNLEETVETSWGRLYSNYISNGYTAEQILKECCMKGIGSYEWHLEVNTNYVAVAYAVNDMALVCSNISSEKFTTGDVPQSDIQLTLEVSNIQARTADVLVTADCEDEFTAIVVPISELKDMDDAAIIDYLNQYKWLNSYKNEYKATVEQLVPETDYALLAFGYKDYKSTSGLFRADFKTTEPVVGKVTAQVTFNAYYDVKAVADVDKKYEDCIYSGDLFLPYEVITDPADVSEFYFKAFAIADYEGYGDLNDDAYVISQFLWDGPTSDRKGYTYLTYDKVYVVMAMATDSEGNYGPVWRSEPFTPTKDGVAAPQEFIDLMKQIKGE